MSTLGGQARRVAVYSALNTTTRFLVTGDLTHAMIAVEPIHSSSVSRLRA